MALGKYSRIDGRRPSSSYCSTVTLVVFVALCLVGVWMMTSSSVVPIENEETSSGDNKNEAREQVTESMDNGNKQLEGNPVDFPEDATKGDNNVIAMQSEGKSNDQEIPHNSEKSIESVNEGNEEHKPADKYVDKGNKSKSELENVDMNNKDGESHSEGKNEGDDGAKSRGQVESGNGSSADKSYSNGSEKKSDSDENEKQSGETKDGNGTEGHAEKQQNNQETESEQNFGEKIDDSGTRKQVQGELFPSGAQSELLKENVVQNGTWSTQAAESNNEKDAQQSSVPKQQAGYSWKLCNVTAGPDYIPCLDNIQAIRKLRSTKHYEHRERHCPEVAPSCLVPLPEGYQTPIEWPTSREKIWYHNVPHTQLAQYKGHQNWVKVSGEYLTFPGGGTQFQHGALHYIEFIEKTVREIKWGKRTRVVLDVGCGVASFGGFLFEKDVLTMSFAPKDEHEAQVQFALERGIPAISSVMGTKRLPFPGRVFDVLHCARCRVPWHIEGGKLLLELNRVLRPGGFFVWSATPVYQKLDEDVEIWNAMKELTKSMCWELVAINKDKLNGVGVAIYRKPSSNECYEKRIQNEPPLCQESDDPNAAWNVPLQSCMHKVPVDASKRGSQWPEQWPARLRKPPYWLLSSQVGVYGRAAPEDFISDYQHWQRVVSKTYLNGMGIKWFSVRNVMDMRAVYGGFAAALRDLNVWVMNVVSVDSPDTLPIIYERGLFGIYHDWCESFSTYPRSYDLLHADHIFSNIKKKCNLSALVAEVDRILRPEGRLIIRDTIEITSELENLLRSMQWEVGFTYSMNKEALLVVQKTMWRPKEVETIVSAIGS